MGRPKGGRNREWTVEMKMEVLNYYFSGHSFKDTQKKFSIHSNRFLNKMISDYTNGGKEALKSSRKPGNPLAKYSSRKKLTELEEKEYEIMRLKIENMRLKKGYTEADAILAKKKSSEKNSK